jgi:transcriptional regulator with XRE-family HTH domain
MPITPEQSRAARALLDWSQEDLETRAQVAKKTIADFERGAQIPYKRTLNDIEATFGVAGVLFIAENGGGVGVRLGRPTPRLARKKISRAAHLATLVVQYRGQEIRVTMPTEILYDMDHLENLTEQGVEGTFQAHLNQILMRAADAIDAGRADDGQLLLMRQDFA